VSVKAIIFAEWLAVLYSASSNPHVLPKRILPRFSGYTRRAVTGLIVIG
jgi:hypothetical protein